MEENNPLDDPLLSFFQELLNSDQEKEIIALILKNNSVDKIIENIIQFKTESKSD